MKYNHVTTKLDEVIDSKLAREIDHLETASNLKVWSTTNPVYDAVWEAVWNLMWRQLFEDAENDER